MSPFSFHASSNPTSPSPRKVALFATLAGALCLTLGGLPAATATPSTQDSPSDSPVDTILADGVEVTLNGQYLIAADGDPLAPETVIHLDSGKFVPVDAASVDPSVDSGDMVLATVEVPGAFIASLPPETLAEIAASGDVGAAAAGPVDEGGEVAGLVLDAVANSSERLTVADESVLEVAQSPGSAEAAPPGPYVHTMHVVFITRDSRRVFWTKSQLDGYVNGLSQWWNRESRGAVTATYNWNDVIGIQSDVQCSSSLPEVQSAATNALAAAGQPVYDWTTNTSQHHLVVLTASDEEIGGCSHSFAGHGWLLRDFSSPGAMRNIVSASADTSQSPPLSTFIHETGHNFGLSHAGSLTCPSGKLDGEHAGTGACSVANYGNQYNIMGYSYGSVPYSILSSQKAQEHLITDGEGYLTIASPVTGGLYTISAASTQDLSARQGLRILDSVGGQQRTYWVDYLSNAEGG
ncbi:MAG: zinc-dependent metalloprotease, partial [Bifidobacteriaceae bacterium]|nr:zinc-dependent metalloprotease [Bifidobacteriaceae bacterium]